MINIIIPTWVIILKTTYTEEPEGEIYYFTSVYNPYLDTPLKSIGSEQVLFDKNCKIIDG